MSAGQSQWRGRDEKSVEASLALGFFGTFCAKTKSTKENERNPLASIHQRNTLSKII